MSILGLIVILAIFGFCLWLILTFIPMPQPVKTVIVAVAVLFLVLYILSVTGLVAGLNQPIRIR